MRKMLSTTLLLAGCSLIASTAAPAQSLIYANGFEPPVVCLPPAGFTGETVNFVATFGTSWPAYNGAHRLQMTPNAYIALAFTATQTPGQFGTFDGSGYPGDGDGAAVMSISTTPGCFDPNLLPPGCFTGPSAFPGISWVNGNTGFSCPLVAGQNYYLNITFGPLNSGAACPGNLCGRDFGNTQAIINP